MDKVILVTGGSDGLGKEIAKLLSPDNKVIILSRNKKNLEDVSKELGCDYEVCDVSDPKNVEGAISNITEKYGKIDVLINNAGVWLQGALENNTVDEIQKIFQVNTLGTIFMTREVLPYMKDRAEGLIINIISQSGLNQKAERSIYHASKWALTGFTKSMQVELINTPIKVTGVYPGVMKTELFRKTGFDRDLTNAIEPSEVAKSIKFIIEQDKDTLIPEIGMRDVNGV